MYEPLDWRPILPNYLGPDLAGWVETGRGEELTPENRAELEKERAERLDQPRRARSWRPREPGSARRDAHQGRARGRHRQCSSSRPSPRRRTYSPPPEIAQRFIVLDFNDLQRFPELFENRHRIDTHHLNTAGAQVFTRLVAERWIEEVKARQHAR